MSLPRLVGNAATSIASQIISSGGNFILVILAARAGSANEFGAVAIATVVYTFLIGLVRSLIGEIALVRAGTAATTHTRSVASESAAYTGVLGAAVLLPIAWHVGTQTELGVAILLLAASLPFLLLLDVERYLAFAGRTPGVAVVLDASWLVIFVALSGLLPWEGSNGVWAAWCIGGSVVAIGAVVRRGTFVGPRASALWLRQNADLAGPYLAEFGATSVTSTVPQMILGGVVSKQAVGSIRGAASLFGPLSVLYTGGYTGLVSHLRTDHKRIMTTALGVSASLMILATGLTALLANLPEQLGEAALGASWSSTHAVLVPFGLAMIAAVSAGGAQLGLRALEAARASLRVRLTAAPFALLTQVLGATTAGARGYAIGLSASTTLLSLLLWSALRRQLALANQAV